MKTEIEWIPCAERLPDDDERVLFHCGGDGEVGIGWYDSSMRDDVGGWFCDDGLPLSELGGVVEHWAQLPEVPT